MRPDAYKELTPVIYGKKAIKWLPAMHLQPEHTCFTMHWHERLELLYMHEGALELQLGSEPVTAHAGQLVIINPCQLHAARTGQVGAKYDVVMFDLSHFLNATAAVQHCLPPLIQRDTAFINVTDDPDVLRAVSDLIALQRDTDRHPLCAIGEVYRLLGLLSQRCAAGRPAVHTADEKISTVLTYISGHFTEELSTGELSRRFSYNESYFCRLFKRVTGLTVSAYIRILRLELAQKLLKEPDWDIAVIAARCGFSDAGYFTNCFTRQFGLSPTAFRRQQSKPET